MTEEIYNKAGAIKCQIRELERLNSSLKRCCDIEIISLSSDNINKGSVNYSDCEHWECFNIIKEGLSKLAENKISELKKEFEEL